MYSVRLRGVEFIAITSAGD